ncbi:MAG: helix-turn-helix domain-containing protein [Clostridia bacterium]|nr:helix-turn-helix domain-containing protein [Clostridia bacterium]
MAIFRVAKTRDYTVMSNYHLRDKNLSLKAKGLLSLILSLPEDWNYTTRGLAAICKEGVDSIGAALREMESAGYLTRHRLRDRSGRISDTEYVVYESPRTETEADSPDKVSQGTDEPDTASPCTENPYMVFPDMATPQTDAPDTEKPAQLSTEVSNTYESNTQKSNPDPIIVQKQRAQQADTGMSDMDQMDAREYRKTFAEVKEQIEYDALDTPHDHERLGEIVEIMTETLCSRKPYIKVAGENYPAEVVKSRFKKLSYHHIEYVFLSLDKKHTEVRNIRQYLMTTLYHAPTTMSNYYDAEVRSAGIL